MSVTILRCQTDSPYNFVDCEEDPRAGYYHSILTSSGMDATVDDHCIDPILSYDALDARVGAIAKASPHLVAFVVRQGTNSMYYSRKFAAALRARPELADVHFTVVGDAAVGAESILRDSPFDSFLFGEEDEFRSLCQTVADNGSLDSVGAISYKDRASGEIRLNPPLALNRQLDDLPYPTRYFWDLPNASARRHEYKAAMLGSRSCYAPCSFCHIQAYRPLYGGAYPWRGREPEAVVTEMRHCYDSHGVTNFVFKDLNFFGPGRSGTAQAKQFATALSDAAIPDVHYSIYTRASDVGREVFGDLRRSGLVNVFIGIESLCQAVLDRYHKGTTVETNVTAVRCLQDLDVHVRMGFITYDYFTTFEELRESIDNLRTLHAFRPELLGWPGFFHSIASPLANTPLEAAYANEGALVDPTEDRRHAFPELNTLMQRRSSVTGIGAFRDARIAFCAETTRACQYEMVRKVVSVQHAFNQLIEDLEAGTTPSIDPQSLKDTVHGLIAWNDQLNLFALTEFERIVEHYAAAGQPTIADLETTRDRFYQEMLTYNRRFLPAHLSGLETTQMHSYRQKLTATSPAQYVGRDFGDEY